MKNHTAKTASIDLVVNRPSSWQRSAGKLLTASRILKTHHDEVWRTHKAEFLKNGTPSMPSPETEIHWIQLMLVGFAIENLLKGLWLASGKILYDDARMRPGSLGKKAHDLVELSFVVGFELNDEEKANLRMLTRIVLGAGRYPMTKDESQELARVSWTHESDTRIHGLIDRLSSQLESTSKKNHAQITKSRWYRFHQKTGLKSEQ